MPHARFLRKQVPSEARSEDRLPFGAGHLGEDTGTQKAFLGTGQTQPASQHKASCQWRCGWTSGGEVGLLWGSGLDHCTFLTFCEI